MFDSNEQLRAALHESVTDLSTTPEDLLPALRKRYAQRVTARRVGLVATPLVVAAAIAGSVAIAPDSGPAHPASASGATTAPVLDVAYVTARVTQALDNASHDITYVKWTLPTRAGHSQVFEIWVEADGSAVHKRLSEDGNVLSDEEFTTTGILVVDHTGKQYYHAPASGTGATLPNGRNDVGFPLPQEIKQALDSGAFTIVGNEVINGQPTIHLHDKGSVPGFLGASPFDDLWVSQSSYLPIRVSGGPRHESQDYTWLPPTPENLALLTPPIPAGYQEISGK